MHRVKTIIPLALLLLAFWVLLSNDLKLWTLLIGALVSILLAVLSNYLIPSEIYSHFSIGFVFRIPVFLVILIWEIIKSNWDVLRIVLSPSLPIDPKSAEFETCLESHTAITVLAAAINLTPGTVTLEIDGPRFYIHSIGGALKGDVLDRRLERMVAWLFREGPREGWRLR